MQGKFNYIIILLFVFIATVFASEELTINLAKIQQQADSLYLQQEYSKAYFLYQQIDSNSDLNSIKIKTSLYNLAVLLAENEDALIYAKELYEKDRSCVNLQRFVYSNALNNTDNEKIGQYVKAGIYPQTISSLNLLAGLGYLDGYNYLSGYNWFDNLKKENKEVENLELWHKKAQLLSGLNILNFSANYMNYKYHNSSQFEDGNWFGGEISTAYKNSQLGFAFSRQKDFEKKDRIFINSTDYANHYQNIYTNTYNSKYYLIEDGSLLLDLTEIYENTFIGDSVYSVKDTISQKADVISKFEYAAKYSYLFNDRIDLSLTAKFVDVENSLFDNVSSFGLGLKVKKDRFSWDGQINYEKINSQYYSAKKILEQQTSVVTENYTTADTTSFSNEYGNEELHVSTYDSTVVKKYYTNYSYLNYELKDENYNFIYYRNRLNYSISYFSFLLENYCGLISKRELKKEQWRNFNKCSVEIYPIDNVTIFGSYFTGEKFLFNTDDYSSLGLSEDGKSNGYNCGIDYHFETISTNLYLKYQNERYDDYRIESLLLGFSLRL